MKLAGGYLKTVLLLPCLDQLHTKYKGNNITILTKYFSATAKVIIGNHDFFQILNYGKMYSYLKKIFVELS